MAVINKKILWADDEIEQLGPHILFLEEKGYEVISVNSGEDAIEYCSKNYVDLILIDEMMTGLDGISSIRIIKKKYPDIPIIMVTKNEEEWLMDEAIGTQISNYLTKPVNPSQILIACKNILENKKIQTDRTIQDFIKYFNDLSVNIKNINNIDNWFELYNNICDWSIKLDNVEDKNILNMLDDQKNSANHHYSNFIVNNYKNWIEGSKDSPVLSHQIFNDVLKPRLNSNKKLVFIIIDCLRLDQWKKISALLFPLYQVEENYHVSIIPTATPYARNAIFSGLLPNDLKQTYPELWHKMFKEDKSLNSYEDILFSNMLQRYNYDDLKCKYYKISDYKSGLKLLNKINDYKNIDILNIVVNFVDILGHSRSESQVLSELIPNETAYRQSIYNWFSNSWLFDLLNNIKSWNDTEIVITSDHGNTIVNKPTLVKGDQQTSMGVRYKYGRNLRTNEKNVFKITNPTEFNLPSFDVSTEYIIAKDYSYFVYKNDYHKYVNMYKNTFQHGGITMDEMFVPLIHLKGKESNA